MSKIGFYRKNLLVSSCLSVAFAVCPALAQASPSAPTQQAAYQSISYQNFAQTLINDSQNLRAHINGAKAQGLKVKSLSYNDMRIIEILIEKQDARRLAEFLAPTKSRKSRKNGETRSGNGSYGVVPAGVLGAAVVGAAAATSTSTSTSATTATTASAAAFVR